MTTSRWTSFRMLAAALMTCCAAPALLRAAELKPYGFVLVNAVEHWNRPNYLDVPTQALSTDDADTRDTYNDIFARQTRLGLVVKGIEGIQGAQTSATAEMDFWGNRASGSGSNDVLQSSPRLRLAFLQFQWERHSLVIGQDWAKAFSPLNPASLLHVSVVPMCHSGNLWNRLPQLRWDGRFEPEGLGATVNVRAAIVRAFSADQSGRTSTVGTTVVTQVSQPDQPGSGELSGGPGYQGLVELTRKFAGRDFTVGASGQYLRQRFRAGVVAGPGAVPNGVAGGAIGSVHAVLPVLEAVELSGEGFYGRSNANVYGLGQVYADGDRIKTSLTRGGWVQVRVNVAPTWKTHLAYGGEKVNETGLALGKPYRNETVTANVVKDFSKELSLSAEYGMIRTYFAGKAAGRTHSLALGVMARFGA